MKVLCSETNAGVGNGEGTSEMNPGSSKHDAGSTWKAPLGHWHWMQRQSLLTILSSSRGKLFRNVKQGLEQGCPHHLSHVSKMLDLFKSASLAPGKVKRSQFNTKLSFISSYFNFLEVFNMKVKSVVSGSIPAIIHRNSLGHIAPSVSHALLKPWWKDRT